MTRNVAIAESGFFARLGAVAGGPAHGAPAGSLRPLLGVPGEGLGVGDLPEAEAAFAQPHAITPARLEPEPIQPATQDAKPQTPADGNTKQAGPARLDAGENLPSSPKPKAEWAKDAPETVRAPASVAALSMPDERRDGPSPMADERQARSGPLPQGTSIPDPIGLQAPAPIYRQQEGPRPAPAKRTEHLAMARAMPTRVMRQQEPVAPETTIEIHIGAIELRGRPVPAPPAPLTAQPAPTQAGNLSAYLARRSRGAT